MRRRSLACVMLLVALALPSTAHAATTTVVEYRERVVAARAAVEKALPGVADEAAARELAATVGELLPESEKVDVGGTEVTVDNSGLEALVSSLDAAGSAEPRREAADRILAQLDSQVAALGTPGPALPTDPAALDRILKEEGVGGAQSARSTLLAELQKLMSRIIDWLTSAGDQSAVRNSFRVVYYALLAISGLAVMWVVVLVIRRLRSSRVRGDASDAADVQGPVVAAAEGLPDDALAFADSEAAAGRSREAVRALFGGAARELVERGVVPRTRTRTTRELLGDVEQARPRVVPPLRALASAFEPAWYGHVEPGASGYADARAVYVTLLDMLVDAAGESS